MAVPQIQVEKHSDVTLDSKENAVKLLHGIEINDVEYNVSLIFSDTTVVSFMKLPSYIEDEDRLLCTTL
jgi:hypothetical protein